MYQIMAVPLCSPLDVYIFAVGPTISHQDLMLLATEAEQNRGRHYFRIHEEEMENMFDEMFGKKEKGLKVDY